MRSYTQWEKNALMPLQRPRSLVTQRLRAAILDAGLALEVSWDMAAFNRANAALPRGRQTPIFDLRYGDIAPGAAFWVAGRTPDGALAHVQAVRLVGPVEPDLAGYLSRERLLYSWPRIGVDADRSEVPAGGVGRGMTGRACYHGEMWLARSLRGYGLLPPLSAFALATAAEAWAPDFVFGMTLATYSNDKYVRALGYTDIAYDALIWRDAAGELIQEEALVWGWWDGVAASIRRVLQAFDGAAPPVPCQPQPGLQQAGE